jgi:hypothetical protein
MTAKKTIMTSRWELRQCWWHRWHPSIRNLKCSLCHSIHLLFLLPLCASSRLLLSFSHGLPSPFVVVHVIVFSERRAARHCFVFALLMSLFLIRGLSVPWPTLTHTLTPALSGLQCMIVSLAISHDVV